MKSLTGPRLFRIVFYLVVGLLAATRARAHEPFDVSTRVMIYRDRMELSSILGASAARHLFSAAGLSPEEITESLASRGPDAFVTHPATLGARFFHLRKDDQPVVLERVTSVSEGMEIIITLTFPRPSAGSLEFRAVCYETIPELGHGVLIVEDEAAGRLGSALLSTARTALVVQLPGIHSPVTGPDANAQLNVDTDAEAAVQSRDQLLTEADSPVRPSFWEFFLLGVEHILKGLDHLLFLVALLIGVRKPASMLGIITGFTLAHSVTLALAALEVVSLSSRIIEPLIAASIIVVCLANFARRSGEADRVGMAAGFGLIHGFGFASALRDTGVGQDGVSIVMPLLSFNLGVETGQLAVAAIFLPLLVLARRSANFTRYGKRAVSACVILVSGFWLLERILF